MKNLRTSVLATVVVGVLAASPAFAASKAKPITRTTHAYVNLNGIGDSQSYGRFIVIYRDGAATKNNRTAIVKNMGTALTRAGLATKAKPTTASYMRKLAIGADLVRTSRMLDHAEAQAFMRQIATDPNVASVSLDVKRQIVRDIKAPAKLKPMVFTPGDTYFGDDQWNLKAPDGSITSVGGVANLGGSKIDSAWDLADGTGITIAVLDTGITEHPDVNTSMADAGYDFISDADTSGRATDERVPGGWDLGDWTTEAPWINECVDASHPAENSSWHGTHVASSVGAELTDNDMGEAGIAYNAKVIPVRVLGHCGGYDSDINDAIIWAAGGHVDGVPDNANPAQVINLSLGGGGACTANDPAALAVAQANALGAVVVVAAGNDGSDASNYSPASCPGVITVASTGITSKRAYYSNYGTAVELAAPGGGIYTNDGSSGAQAYDGFIWQALNDGTTTPTPLADIDPLSYGGFAGTSQATPHVTGTVALMQSARLAADMPLLTPTEVVTILQSTAYAPAVAPAANRQIGAGILDAGAAVAAAIVPPCTEDCGPVATPLTKNVALTGLSGAGAETLYSYEATAGSVLSIMTYGGSGDASVYVSFGSEPTTTDSDAKSTRPGNTETVRFTAPQAGTYFIKVTGSYSGMTIAARQ